MSLIIDQPSLTSIPKRIGWGGVTFLFWTVWIYLWMPFITLAAWMFGYYQAYSQFRWEQEVEELKRLVILYTTIVAWLGGSLLLWARVEYMRFRNVHRRAWPVPATTEDLARYAELPAAEVNAWQHARCVIARHDEHGKLVGADVRE
ncbi:poly-beta-1,6-N-acetyl-D-glucosamine biosynthesis protein PgaD [Noviherbaspirillum cavernae]|uniref:Poly-beta-1,6-N-acetyl-D-glucosamine biosynthesis protein PgaD n=1 Tax=Noviherbaspirillum cavernae TaxID=2320862 RepID=A0A418X111_9BURK|nr:poly-beta-1,6-N-acetyl-D-glucosamine biosynthesis protein PgaD [Noviherbaspirillum cavernae]RJG06025.1 poly-beta-1,6-N-acetyl-D-glucosamine biosynthesis protein PgaD [Noviherbaspirillum cavernae]